MKLKMLLGLLVLGMMFTACGGGDDDDSAAGDDDVVGDDDDVVGDDDDATGGCPGCTYSFDINYTTANENGACMFCIHLDPGTWSLGYGSGTVYLEFPGYGWYWWYYGAMSGDTVDFWYSGYYYDYTLDQSGYWNITGGGSDMTGRATTEETTAGTPHFTIVQDLAGTAI